MRFAVFTGCGQQFVDRDEDHDARHPGQDAAHQRRRHEGRQHQPCQHGPDRFGEAREQRQPESLFAVARGVVNRDRDGDAFGDVVDGDGYGDRDAQGHVVHRRREGGDAFREVVDADGQRRHHAHAHQFRVAGLMVHLLDAVGFVGVLERGNQPVDNADQQDAREETRHGDDRARMSAPFGREGRIRLLEQLHERDVNHHAARQAQRERQQSLVGAFGEEGDGAADARCEARAERQQQGNKYVVFFHADRFGLFCKNSTNSRTCPGLLQAKIAKDAKNRASKDPVFSDRAIVITYWTLLDVLFRRLPGRSVPPSGYLCASRISSPNTSMLSAVMWGCGSAWSATSSVVSPESTSTPIAPALWAIWTSV